MECIRYKYLLLYHPNATLNTEQEQGGFSLTGCGDSGAGTAQDGQNIESADKTMDSTDKAETDISPAEGLKPSVSAGTGIVEGRLLNRAQTAAGLKSRAVSVVNHAGQGGFK